jgi:hypothetical protein
MFIAHIPFAYATTKIFISKLSDLTAIQQKRLLLFGMGSGILPDIDVLFYLLEESGKRQHHHDHLPHWPFTWLTIGLATYALSTVFSQKRRPIKLYGGVLVFQGLFHIIWDFASAPIKWVAPFSPISYPELFQVTECTVEENWCRRLPIWEDILGFSCPQTGPLSYVRDMICYKTFLIEVIICGFAFAIWMQYRHLEKHPTT